MKLFNRRKSQNNQEEELTVDIFRQNNDLFIIAPLPGVAIDDINIAITNDILTIQARNNINIDGECILSECNWGTYSRTIILPFPVADTITDAELDDGILTIKIPITKEFNTIKIKKFDI